MHTLPCATAAPPLYQVAQNHCLERQSLVRYDKVPEAVHFRALLKSFNSRFLSQKTPYQLCRFLSYVLMFFKQGPENLYLRALSNITYTFSHRKPRL